jgi:hypothetical protein
MPETCAQKIKFFEYKSTLLCSVFFALHSMGADWIHRLRPLLQKFLPQIFLELRPHDRKREFLAVSPADGCCNSSDARELSILGIISCFHLCHPVLEGFPSQSARNPLSRVGVCRTWTGHRGADAGQRAEDSSGICRMGTT